MSNEDDLLEYSVIYTDRAKNLMAGSFSKAYQDIYRELCQVYQADHCVLIPGSGSYAMEAVAGQFARHRGEAKYAPALVIRNGYFSFRWTDIWDWIFPANCGRSPELRVLKAQPVVAAAIAEERKHSPAFQPPDLETAVAQIKATKPCVVFCPHVETSDGIIVSDDYIKALVQATHEADPDAIFVLDCIASGNVWARMKDLGGIDVLITAPQKGWTSPASVGIAMMSTRAKNLMERKVRGHSFCCNLSKWSTVADKYMSAPGAFMYHTTLPTDALVTFRDVILETKAFGYQELEKRTHELGQRVRTLLESKGFHSVAAAGCKAPTVVVSYMRDDKDRGLVGQFKQHGLQLAAGVPLKIDEPWANDAAGPPTFRIGLFGLDKLKNVDKAVQVFEDALNKVLEQA